MATLGMVVSTTLTTDTGDRTFIGLLRALHQRVYAVSSALPHGSSPHRSGAGSMAAEGTRGWRDLEGAPGPPGRGWETQARRTQEEDGGERPEVELGMATGTRSSISRGEFPY
jgi:hypothetical protein